MSLLAVGIYSEGLASPIDAKREHSTGPCVLQERRQIFLSPISAGMELSLRGWFARARRAAEPDGFAAPIGGANREGPRCGPSLFVASPMCESWNQIEEWIRGVALVPRGHS